MPNCFYFILWSGLAGRSVQSYEKKIFLIVFSRLDPIPQVFRQVKECLILKFHEMIRVLQKVACPVVFISFYDQGCQGGVKSYELSWQGGMYKVMKNDDFSLLLAVWVFFSKILGRLRRDLC